LKLAGGSWLINLAGIHWRSLAIDKVVEGEWVDHPDLTKVDEIGWTDLMTGGGSSACSRVDWIEVYGRRIQRQ
jgi:hypothetical protein